MVLKFIKKLIPQKRLINYKHQMTKGFMIKIFMSKYIILITIIKNRKKFFEPHNL